MSDDQAFEEYKGAFARLIRKSTLMPGRCAPSPEMMTYEHAAVLAGGVPVILCGSAANPVSIRKAEALATCPMMRLVLACAGFTGPIGVELVDGSRIDWKSTETAILGKESGEARKDRGPLMAIVLDDPHRALAAYLCTTTAAARAIDPEAPELDDGTLLPRLARAAMGPSPVTLH